jgi:hypothetical protein
MSMHIHLGFHFYGAGNAGDDLMTLGFLREIKRLGFAPAMTCCTPFDIESQRLRFPEIEWLAYDPQTRRNAVKNCDLWLGLGGTPFHSASNGWFFEHLRFEIELIREFDRPAYMLCVGVNGHDVARNPETNGLLSSMRLLWTRDSASAAALAQLEGPGRIRPMADLAHLCFDVRRPVRAGGGANEPLILVIHSEDPLHISPQVLDEVILGHDGPVYWYCQEVREFGCTEMATYRRLSDAALAKLTLVRPDYHGSSIENLISVFDKGGVCLTSRYHSALIASWMGLRVAVFARNAKLDGAIEQLGLTGVRSLTLSADIREALAKAKPVDANTLQGLRQTASAACRDLFRMADL